MNTTTNTSVSMSTTLLAIAMHEPLLFIASDVADAVIYDYGYKLRGVGPAYVIPPSWCQYLS